VNIEQTYWAVIPAAGIGKRMQSQIPKQYLPLAGRTVIEHTVELFLQHPHISGVVVAISEADETWQELHFDTQKPLLTVSGGAERCHSVLNALDALSEQASDADWVLVHDAARPCLQRKDLDMLMTLLAVHPVGGLLGVPVRDTIKRADVSCEVEETVNRDGLWHALTPQMFHLGSLRNALRSAVENGQLVTDESSAIELSGQQPVMVEGSADNIKITRPEDLALAEFFLRHQHGLEDVLPGIYDSDGLNADEG
jgi:2-C-methyl-D-erythritol 4-phosphate cytidylyltransferase